MTNYYPANSRNNGVAQPFNDNQKQYIIDQIIKYSGGSVGLKGNSVGFLRGLGVPANQFGNNGDIYLDTTNGNLYQKINGTWTFLINLEGDPGNKGQNGLSFISANGPPQDQNGVDGDTYLDLLTDNIYVKEMGLWTFQTSIKGDDGIDGQKGDKGDAGQGDVIALGFSALTTIPTPGFFPVGTTVIDPLVPTNLSGQYYNINNTILLDGTVNITQSGYWYIQQKTLVQNGGAVSFISAVEQQFLDSLNNPIFEIINENIPVSLDGFIGASRNLYLSVGTYRFRVSITVSGLIGLSQAQYPQFFYGLQLFSPDVIV